MPIEIRPMSPAHYESVFALWQSTEGMGLSDADSRESIERYLARNPGMSFVAMDSDRIIGAVLSGHDGRRGYLHHLAVAPGHRRRAIGRQLVQRCLDALKAEGIRKCHLFLLADNKNGLAFWQKVGWTDRVDLKLMSRSL